MKKRYLKKDFQNLVGGAGRLDSRTGIPLHGEYYKEMKD